MWRHLDRLRGRVSESRLPAWRFKSHTLGVSFWFSFGESFWFAWLTTHVWYISGSSHVCACICWLRWILLESFLSRVSLDTAPPWPLKSLSWHVWSGRPPDFENEKYVVWAGPTSFLNCPDFLFLEFWSVENESLVPLPWGNEGAIHLLPESICGWDGQLIIQG